MEGVSFNYSLKLAKASEEDLVPQLLSSTSGGVGDESRPSFQFEKVKQRSPEGTAETEHVHSHHI